MLAGLTCPLAGLAQTCSGVDAYGQPAQAGLVAEYYKGYFADKASYFTNNAAFPLKSPQNPAYIERVESSAPAYTSNGAWSSSGLNLYTAGVASTSDAVPSQFSARYRGQLYIDVAGSYTFYLNSDDASYLAIDADASQQIPTAYLINNGGAHSAREVTGTRMLSVGWHSIELFYGNQTGNGTLSLQYSATTLGISQRSIPSSKLCTGIISVPTGLVYAPAAITTTAGTAASSGTPSVLGGNQPVTSYAIANASSLPPGITLNATTGALLADATLQPGNYSVSVSAANASGAAAFPAVYTFYVNTACAGPDGAGNAAQSGLYSEFYSGYFGAAANGTDTDANLAYFNQHTPSLKTTVPMLNVDGQSAWSSTYGLNLTTAGAASGTDAQPTAFSARFRGQLTINTSGDYTFYLTSDDGSYLFLDAAAVAYSPTISSATINNGPAHSKVLKQATVTLAAGTHDLLVLYGNSATNSYLTLEYSTAAGLGLGQQIIPATVLCSTTRTLKPLPVTLVRFGAQARGAGVELSWETATELSSAAFVIERSTDGTAFGQVSQVAAAGNSVTTRAYQAFDAAPLPGLSYYRLRQVDTDGSAHYSPVAAVQRGSLGAAPALTLAPNPSTGHLLVQLAQATAQPVQLQVVSALGQVVYQQALPAATTAALPLDLSVLPAGVYVVRVVAATGVTTQRLVRQ